MGFPVELAQHLHYVYSLACRFDHWMEARCLIEMGMDSQVLATMRALALCLGLQVRTRWMRLHLQRYRILLRMGFQATRAAEPPPSVLHSRMDFQGQLPCLRLQMGFPGSPWPQLLLI